jgi:hypothetical protein
MQFVLFMFVGIALMTGAGVIFLWDDPSSTVLIIKGLVVLPLDLLLVGFGLWLAGKESSETRGIRFDPAKDEVQILTVGTGGDLKSSTCTPVPNCTIAIHPVALALQDFTWNGFALIADLGTDSMALACRKHREQLVADLSQLPEWCRHLLSPEDGDLLTGDAADLRLGGSDD